MDRTKYSDLLKNPNWQKKRLEILNRDNFTCVHCGKGIKDDTTLHIHHLKYIRGRLPWEYDNNNFITLCNDCHKKTHSKQKKSKKHNRILYREFLDNNTLGANDKIILSFLLSNVNNMGLTQTKIAQILGIDKSCVCRFFKRNIDASKYQNYKAHGFFNLVESKILKGELLIFYSWLLDLKKDKHAIYAKREKIASMYNKPLEYIRDYLQRLKKLGLIERGKNLELIVK